MNSETLLLVNTVTGLQVVVAVVFKVIMCILIEL